MSIYIWDKEIKNLFVWESTSVSDMQWPCPDGFHIPLSSEWQSVYNVWVSIGAWGASWWDNFKNYLKIPLAWYLSYQNSGIQERWAYWYYWACSSSDIGYAYSLYFHSASINPWSSNKKTNWFPIRWFKDSSVVPDNTRTVLKQWTWTAGIYHNSALWLISLSSDWATWITIADKNLWATTAWNSWDTYSESNIGWYYQRGNNYKFPYSWGATTSSTKVDASAYWPWDYYSSSTFITSTSSASYWDSSNNQNLWWWVTQWTTEKWAAKAVYLWETKVRPTFVPKTFTISRTEKQNMSSWWTYSDDAAWLTAWSTVFDEFFWYYGCRLNENWEETAQITQAQSWWNGKLDITQLWTLTSGDNVMICFPKRWIKMTKSWTTVTLSITNEENKSWYQYYAFNDNWVQKDKLYIWTYKISYSSSKPWSLSWKSLWNSSLASYCSNINSGYSSHRYHLETIYTRWYIAALYMMKYGNPYSQGVIWNWYISSYTTTSWGTNSITNATWATASGATWRIKLFWLEDRWGNGAELLDWAYASSNTNLKVSTSQAFSTTSYISTFDTDLTVARFWMYNILWTNAWMFAASTTWSSSSDASKYYRSSFSPYKSSYLHDWWPSSVDTTNILSIGNMWANDAYSSFAGRMIYL